MKHLPFRARLVDILPHVATPRVVLREKLDADMAQLVSAMSRECLMQHAFSVLSASLHLRQVHIHHRDACIFSAYQELPLVELRQGYPAMAGFLPAHLTPLLARTPITYSVTSIAIAETFVMGLAS
jgi:hypothetical protein